MQLIASLAGPLGDVPVVSVILAGIAAVIDTASSAS